MTNGIEWLTTNNSISKFKSSKCVCLLLGKNQHWYLTEKEMEVLRKLMSSCPRQCISGKVKSKVSGTPHTPHVHAHPPCCLRCLKAVRRMTQGVLKPNWSLKVRFLTKRLLCTKWVGLPVEVFLDLQIMRENLDLEWQ